MRMRGPNNVGRTVQTDPTLLRYASAITEQKKCWELLAQKFDRFQTLSKNSQQHATTYNRVCNGTYQRTQRVVGQQFCVRLHGTLDFLAAVRVGDHARILHIRESEAGTRTTRLCKCASRVRLSVCCVAHLRS